MLGIGLASVVFMALSALTRRSVDIGKPAALTFLPFAFIAKGMENRKR